MSIKFYTDDKTFLLGIDVQRFLNLTNIEIGFGCFIIGITL